MNKLKQINFNKKGTDMPLSTVIALLLLGALVVIFFVFVFPGIINNSKDLGDVLKTGDFDGDNKENVYASDLFDPCPCGTDNEPQLLLSEDVNYCVSSASDCDVRNTLANTMYKEDTGEKKDQKFFFNSDGKCLYSAVGCKYYIMNARK